MKKNGHDNIVIYEILLVPNIKASIVNTIETLNNIKGWITPIIQYFSSMPFPSEEEEEAKN